MPGGEAFCLSRDPVPKKIGSVRALPWRDGSPEEVNGHAEAARTARGERRCR